MNRAVRGAVCAAVGLMLVVVCAPAGADEATIGYGPLRQNWDSSEPGLTQSVVTQPDFGQLWSRTLGGGEIRGGW